MATDGFAFSRLQTRPMLAPWFADTVFVALLLLVFVGLSPFEVRDAATIAASSGEGSIARQLCYLAVFAGIAASAYGAQRLDSLSAVPVAFIVLLGWCFLSAAWAHEPAIVMRRAGLEFVIVFSVMLSVNTIGAERALRLWRNMLALILIVNWISILFVPQAVHLASEGKPQLIGDWRGLYSQKNTAGIVTAVSAVIFLYDFLRQRRWTDLALLVAALVFLAMTRSKTSISFLPIAILLGAIYRLAWKRDIDRWFIVLSGALVLVVVATVAATHTDQIARILNSPTAFTGRSEIWRAAVSYSHDHLILGSGYGTFSDTGNSSPLRNYIHNQWVVQVQDSHDGYLQLLVTIGLIGFTLAMVTLVVIPLYGFWRSDPDNLPLKSLLFALFTFGVLHNFLETDYLGSDAPAWISFLIVIAMLRTMRVPRVGNGA